LVIHLKVDALELPITLVDAFLQYKEELNIEWSWSGTHLTGGWTPLPTASGASLRRIYFNRMPLYPDWATLSSLDWKMPTFNQAALGVSLLTVLGWKK
jgi:hypothetical protein